MPQILVTKDDFDQTPINRKLIQSAESLKEKFLIIQFVVPNPFFQMLINKKINNFIRVKEII